MPKLAAQLGECGDRRSMRAPALVHTLRRRGHKGRNPAGVLGNGLQYRSVVAIEKAAERKPNQVVPTSLRESGGALGPDIFRRRMRPQVTPSTTGLKNTTNSDGERA